jgi:hypothetical protein
MKHLTIDEIIDFVTSENITDSLVLASRVNGHIVRCQECFNKVRAFQNVYDGLVDAGTTADIKEALSAQTIIEEAELKE